MNKSKIMEYISAKSVFLIKRQWFPILGTVVFSVMLMHDYIEALYGDFELISITLFRLIYISSFWIMYFSDKEFSKLNDSIRNNGKSEQLKFDETIEQTFQKKAKAFGLNVSLLIVSLLFFEGFRFMVDIISLSISVEITVFVSLLISSIVLYVFSFLSYKQILDFLKSIIFEKLTSSSNQ